MEKIKDSVNALFTLTSISFEVVSVMMRFTSTTRRTKYLIVGFLS